MPRGILISFFLSLSFLPLRVALAALAQQHPLVQTSLGFSCFTHVENGFMPVAWS
jgi:hypothetical protein